MTLDRLEFLKLAMMASAASTMAPSALAKTVGAARPSLPERNRRPYSGLDWSKCHQIHTTTHGHCTADEKLKIYLDRGFGFFTMSNYYPAAPYYPARKMRRNQFNVGQNHAIFYKGKRTEGPFNWNEIIAAWKDELPPEMAKRIPFKLGGPMFPSFPKDMLEAPNAEHHSFSDITPHLHICAPGSSLTSGHFDKWGAFGLSNHGIKLGFQLPWREAFKLLLDNLITPDGGGITINHPHWSYLPHETLTMLLDFDPRVLGIEVYNSNCDDSYSGSSEVEWDRVLASGRQCFGFFTQDHLPAARIWRGRNILLVEEHSAEACLRAYRQGNFYGAITGSGLRFEYINFDGKELKARADREVFWQMITAQGISSEGKSREFSYTLKEGDREKYKFLRLTARVLREPEKLYTQPFMLD